MKRDLADIDSAARRLDSLEITWLHVMVIHARALGFTVDLFEGALSASLSAVFSQPPYTAPSIELSWVISAVYPSAIVGSPCFGWLADRYGRRRILMGMPVWLGLASLCGAAVGDRIRLLGVFRLLAGLSIGAFRPTHQQFGTTSPFARPLRPDAGPSSGPVRLDSTTPLSTKVRAQAERGSNRLSFS